MLRRRAAAAFMSTKPSGRMEARSLRRTVPVIRFHMRIRRRSMCLVVERRLWGLVEVERKGKGLSSGFWGGGGGNAPGVTNGTYRGEGRSSRRMALMVTVGSVDVTTGPAISRRS